MKEVGLLLVDYRELLANFDAREELSHLLFV
jgi:hypothetical protein